MKIIMMLSLVFALGFSAFAQDKDLIKERLNDAKSSVKARITVIKSAKEEARELRENVKSGQMTKEEAKSRLAEIKVGVRSAKEEIKENSAIIRESRKELRELKKGKRP